MYNTALQRFAQAYTSPIDLSVSQRACYWSCACIKSAPSTHPSDSYEITQST